MAFIKPESFDGLTTEELRKLNDEALAEGRALIAKGTDLTNDEISQAEALMSASQEIESEITRVEQEEAERTARLDALQQGLAEPEPATEDEPEGDEPDGEAQAEEPEALETEEVAIEEKELVVASGTRTVSRAATRAPAPVVPVVEEEKPAGVTLVASANVPGVVAHSELQTMRDVATAFQSRSRSFTGGGGKGQRKVLPKRVPVHNSKGAQVFQLSESAQRYGVAQIQMPTSEFSVSERMSAQEQYDTVISASREARLGQGNLIAAGGWCAPSEQVYGFCELETVSGILDAPTVQVNRGGLSFTKGPDYAALAEDWGFIQTEAEAEAGTVKTCYEVECPPWEEVRLDAIGFCITAGVLTNAAYPELIDRVLQIGTVAYAHKKNAYVINKISTMIGDAIDWSEVGASTSDVLDAVELQATRIRYTYAMAETATIEAVFPLWARGQIRADIGRRLNLDNALNLTDQMIDAWFAVRHINVQWVYDYQPLVATNPGTGDPVGAATATWTQWPTSLEFMMYPAGAYTVLEKPVIDLDTIYDSVGLSTNTYTAGFFESGVNVANTCGAGVKVAVDLDTQGNTGYPSVGDLTNVAPAA